MLEDLTDILNDEHGLETLNELVGEAHKDAGWDYAWRNHRSHLAFAQSFTVSFQTRSDKFGHFSARLMCHYTWTYDLGTQHTVRRGAFALARWPLVFHATSEEGAEALTDAGYALAYSVASMERARIAEENARILARQSTNG